MEIKSGYHQREPGEAYVTDAALWSCDKCHMAEK